MRARMLVNQERQHDGWLGQRGLSSRPACGARSRGSGTLPALFASTG